MATKHDDTTFEDALSDVTLDELREFLEADIMDVKADPAFKERLRKKLWDLVQAHMPETELSDLIVELRSVTSGVGTFTANFDHLSELTGKLADQVLQSNEKAAA